MRYLFFVLGFTFASHAETLDEAYRRLFPHGAYVLQVRPLIENSNRIILKPIRLVNDWSMDIRKRYIFYEVFLARQTMGKLTVTAHWEGREYAVFGSRVFLSEQSGSNFYVKYVLSNNFHVLSKRNLDFLAITKVINLSAEKLIPPFLTCERVF